jgi:amino acid adenylation domain-containing protein
LRVDGPLDGQQPLAALGIDSLMAVEVKNRVATDLGIALGAAELLSGIGLAELAARIAQRLTAPATSPTTASPRSSARSFPLSYGQRALWFGSRLDPESPASNIFFLLRAPPPLDRAALRAAMQRLVDRHAALRTTIDDRGDSPVQRVLEHGAFGWEELDGADLSWAECMARIDASAERPFDLAAGPLLRVQVWQRAEEHLLACTVHHIAVDFWSLVIFVDELARAYRAELEQRPLVLPALASDYAAFVDGQLRMLASEQGQRLRAWWLARLAGRPAALALPFDHDRPPGGKSRAATHTLEIPSSVTTRLRELAGAEHTTLFVVLLATLKAWILHATRQTDVVVGTAALGRGRPELAEVVGYFANPVAVRTDLAGSPTFRELLARVRASILEVLDHEDYPLPLLVEQLQPQRRRGEPVRLFDVWFAWDKAQRDKAQVAFEAIRFRQVGVTFPLSVVVREDDDALAVVIDYDAARFEAATIAGIAASLDALVRGAVSDPSARIDALAASAASAANAAMAAPDAAAAASEQPPIALVPHRFDEIAARLADAEAVRAGARSLTFAALHRRVGEIRELVAARVAGPAGPAGPEPRVGVFVSRTPDWVAAMLGVMAAGATYIPFDPQTPDERVRACVADAGITLLLMDRTTWRDWAGQLGAVTVVRLDDLAAAGARRAHAPAAIDPEQLAYVIYTSGSSGHPKGVMISHGALARHCVSVREVFGTSHADRVLQFASPAFDVSIEQVLVTLLAGATLVLRDDVPWTAEQFVAKVHEHGLTVVNVPPAYFHQLAQLEPAVLRGMGDTVRLMIVGGDHLAVEDVRRWRQSLPPQVRLLNAYGPTEATITATTHELTVDNLTSRTPIGAPHLGRVAYILDAHGAPLPEGSIGELYLGGLTARGYLHAPELTALRFVPDPMAQAPGARLYRTGDLARWLPDGSIDLLGRADRQIKIRGNRVEPGEIEAILARHAEVVEAAIVFDRRPPGDGALVAIVRRRSPVTADELRQHLASALPHYMVPAAFLFVEALPLLASGKVDYQALLTLAETRRAGEEPSADPHNEVEQRLAAIWSEVLGVPHVGVDDNFFELGGHSLTATQVVSRVQREFGVTLPLRALFDEPTVAATSVAIMEARLAALSEDDLAALLGDIERPPGEDRE